MESDKYSLSSFKGLITNLFPYANDTVVTIFTQGLLNIHGIEKEVSIESDLSISGDKVVFFAEFEVFLKDYNIKVPKIVRMNIADTILVNVSGQLINR